MVKKIFVLFISLLMLVMFASCNDSHTHNFTSDSFFHVEEGDDLTNEEMQSVISDIPSDKYESYPNTQNVPVSATLYKNGEKISIDVNDPRLIKLTTFSIVVFITLSAPIRKGYYPWMILRKTSQVQISDWN